MNRDIQWLFKYAIRYVQRQRDNKTVSAVSLWLYTVRKDQKSLKPWGLLIYKLFLKMLVINDYKSTNYSQSIYCSGWSISVDSENPSNPLDTRQLPSGMVVWL